MSGAIQKFNMDGHKFAIKGDSDLSFQPLTRANTESQRNTKGTHGIGDLITPKVTGMTGQWDIGTADYNKFIELAEKPSSERFSCSFVTFEGYKVNTASAFIVIPSKDSLYTTREGGTEFEVHCDNWSKPKKI